MIYVALHDSLGDPSLFWFARDEIIVGASFACDLVIRSDEIQPRHLRVRAVNGSFVIEDPSGVRAAHTMASDDTVRVGDVDLRIGLRDLSPEDVTEPNEQRFLDAIRARSDDVATRSVYADWLEERGHLARAEFLRLQLAAADAPSDDAPARKARDAAARIREYADRLEEGGDLASAAALRAPLDAASASANQLAQNRVAAAARLRELADQVGEGWRARVATTFVENCPSTRSGRRSTVGFEVVCPLRWDRLAPTDRDGVRYCTGCNAEVTYCTSVEQALQITKRGGCISIDVMVRRQQGDLETHTMTGRGSYELAFYGEPAMAHMDEILRTLPRR